jgi:hypothetical protein
MQRGNGSAAILIQKYYDLVRQVSKLVDALNSGASVSIQTVGSRGGELPGYALEVGEEVWAILNRSVYQMKRDAAECVEGTSDDALMGRVLSLSFELALNSIYLPPILHFGRVIGMDRVLVVNFDDLNVGNRRRFSRIMNAVFLFLGLSEFDIAEVELHRDDPSLDAAFPPSSRLLHVSNRARRRLARFFEPFNQRLSQATGLNLTQWGRYVDAPAPKSDEVETDMDAWLSHLDAEKPVTYPTMSSQNVSETSWSSSIRSWLRIGGSSGRMEDGEGGGVEEASALGSLSLGGGGGGGWFGGLGGIISQR